MKLIQVTSLLLIISLLVFLVPIKLLFAQSTTVPSPWETADIGTATTDSKGVYSNTVFTLASSRDGLYASTSTDEFRYVYQTLPGDGEIKARVKTISSGKSRHNAGVMIRQTLAANSMHASTVVTRGNGVKAFYRTSTGGSTSYKDGVSTSLPYWVKIVRKNSTTFEMYQSPDSSGTPVGWILVKSQTISSMTGTLYIGLVAASGYDGVLTSSDIDSVSIVGAATPTPTPTPTPTLTPAPSFTPTPSPIPTSTPTPTLTPTPSPSPTSSPTPTPSPTPTSLPSPWKTQDIGLATSDSKGVYADGVFTLSSSRDGLYASTSTDEFRYVYQTLPGDGEIKARVKTISSGKNRHNAGVMIRQTLAANSPHASTVLTRGNGVKAFYRTTTGGSTSYKDGVPTSLPYWVKIVRKNSTTFEMYQSADSSGTPAGWTLVKSQTISSMTGALYIGLVAASGSDGVLTSSDIDSVSIVGTATPTPTPTPSPTPDNQLLLIALEPIVLAPQACPAGVGPGGILPANYPAEKLTQDQRQWLFTAFGNEGIAPVGYGGERCGDSYDNQNDNFNAMVCASGQTGPGGIVPGAYNPEQLTQDQRQWLFEVFGNSGIAPVGFGGSKCPNQENNYTVDDIHLASVCSSGALGPYNMKPGAYNPTELNQDERQWLWDIFGEDSGGIAPVGYAGKICPGQSQNAPPPDRSLPYNPYPDPNNLSCYSNSLMKLGDIVTISANTSVYNLPNTSSGIAFTLAVGEQITVVSGPHCESEGLWWTIGNSNGNGGFVRESSFNQQLPSGNTTIHISYVFDSLSQSSKPGIEYRPVVALTLNPNDPIEKILDAIQTALNLYGLYPKWGTLWDMANAMISALRGNNDDVFTYILASDPSLAGSLVNTVKLTSGIAKFVPNQNLIFKEAKTLEELRLIAESDSNSIIKLVLPDGPISGSSWKDLSGILKSAGRNHSWDHIVEQGSEIVYGITNLQNTNNLLSIPNWLHTLKSARYSTVDHTLSETLTLRKWIEQNLDFNAAFQTGIDTLSSFIGGN